MKRCFIFINAYEHSEHNLYQPKRLLEELTALGMQADLVRNGDFPAYISGGRAYSKLADYDFGIYLDKDKYVSELLEATGVRLFNSARAVAVCDDKMMTHIALARAGIAQPDTLPAPLCYAPDATVRNDSVDAVATALGLPVVVKESYGSLGKGVRLARTRDELRTLMQSLLRTPHLYQRFAEKSAGRDLRIIVIGGEPVAAMRRVSETDFRSNVELGGRGYACSPPPDYAALAVRAANALRLDYCGVDLLEGIDGPLVCEVNSNAFFGGIERVTGINVARRYAEYLVRATD